MLEIRTNFAELKTLKIVLLLSPVLVDLSRVFQLVKPLNLESPPDYSKAMQDKR